jgi:hypothetical protein
MRSTILLTTLTAAVVLASASCSSSGVKVRTAVEPGASVTGLRTFYVLTPPVRSANAAPLSVNDPMLENSITNTRLRADLAEAFETKGYALASQQSADFLVAYYAGTKEKFDTTYWGPNYAPGWRYSYRGRRGWAWPYYGAGWNDGLYSAYGPGRMSVNTYTQGQVIVDVTDPRTSELLWRGQGVEPVSTDALKYANDLQGVVNAIVAKFPTETAQPPVATGP